MVFEFLRFVRHLKPKAIMMENVPGLAEDERFSVLIERMERLGYVGEHRVLNAADYGVPQRRRRLIYLAGFGFEIPFANAVKKRDKKKSRDAVTAVGNRCKACHDTFQ